MTLAELEISLGLTLPEGFHRIYETGSMHWLELSRPELDAQIKDYRNDASAFLALDGLEPLLFEEIPERMKQMQDWFFDYLSKTRHAELKPGLRLVPFAQVSSVDLYCLLYAPDLAEPKVVLWWHDEIRPVLYASDFEGFLLRAILEAISYEEADADSIAAQVEYLDAKHRTVYNAIPEEDLPYAGDDFVSTPENIWAHIDG